MSTVELTKPALQARISPANITEKQATIIGESESAPVDQFTFAAFLSRLNNELEQNIDLLESAINDNDSRLTTAESDIVTLDGRVDADVSDMSTVRASITGTNKYVAQTSNGPTFDPTVAMFYKNTFTANIAAITLTLSNIPAGQCRHLYIWFFNSTAGTLTLNGWPASAKNAATGNVLAGGSSLQHFICTSSDAIMVTDSPGSF